MADKSNPKQYQRLKASIEAFDAFEPSMATEANAELMTAARAMLDQLYEVYKLKLLLEQLDNKAIAQLISGAVVQLGGGTIPQSKVILRSYPQAPMSFSMSLRPSSLRSSFPKAAS